MTARTWWGWRSPAGPGVSLPSWARAMIRVPETGGLIVQLLLELAESSAPAVALWELVGEQQRQAARPLLAVLIAQTIAGEQTEDEGAVGE